MVFISVRDLRSKASQIWKRIQKERDVVITSNGRPIAILSGISEENLDESLSAIRRSRAIQAVESMQLSSRKAGLDRLSSQEIEREIKAVRKSRPR
jgi:prevent-host-death family protein